MKIIFKSLGAIALISYVTLCHFRQPQISDSIIIGFLAGVFGYSMYLDKVEQPDIRVEVAKAFENRDKKIRELEGAMGAMGIKRSINKKDNIIF